MNSPMQNTAALAGRILLALIFILSGWGKITGYSGAAGYMASAGMPLVNVLLPLAILAELGGGLLLVTGYQARWAAAGLFAFMIPTTLIFHGFWSVPAEQMQMQQIQFLKNLSIMGGMLMVTAFGPGAWSLGRDTAKA